MKTMVYDNENYMVTREDSVTVAVRSTGSNGVKVLTVKESGEVQVISKCAPWLHDTLKSMEVAK